MRLEDVATALAPPARRDVRTLAERRQPRVVSEGEA